MTNVSDSFETTIARIDERTEWIVKTLEQQKACTEDIELRTRVLEENSATLKGRNSAMAAAVSAVVALIIAILSNGGMVF